ncbi:MAG: hypothetical protein BWY99_02702 [Synergistetes bacterium ADurb.BinA166]|nr:MAG: hypothetical protein BWY99_02702 [Synergistetes bacterium ADurb.BinA166]
MNISMKKFVKRRGEHVVGVSMACIMDMASAGSCDSCGKPLSQGDRVVGKTVKLEGFFTLTSRFSPTCFECIGMN